MKPETVKKVQDKFGLTEEMAKDLVRRRRGNSTALALRYVSDAIQNPNTEILVKDHFDSRQADKYLLGTCADIVKKLELVGFKFNRLKNSILFDLSELQAKAFGFPLE